ncbi:MAG: glucuronate isomerase, partial [Verrucomicrobia bacterium]|nr:glucuronate isomerase [Verrucomicrobiota bacterium]
MNKEANEAMIAKRVDKIVSEARVLDIHTHLYAPAFGKLLLWGIDELLVYHYLLAEAFRYFKLPYDKFHAMSKAEQAELVWDELFVKRSPVSEACRGVITSLNRLGLEPRQKDLNLLRKWFAEQDTDEYVSRCMELAGVDSLCMTNSPFDDAERQVWDSGFDGDGRFVAALRIDPLLVSWPKTCEWLKENGY